ncbi:hypothetical protein MGI18_12595 [Bacillus sp. OVS6]|nr:hypothetical protein MGI18_12595 [Bacillus sp. OVS6]
MKLITESNAATIKEHADFLQRVLRENPGISRKGLQQLLQHAVQKLIMFLFLRIRH